MPLKEGIEKIEDSEAELHLKTGSKLESFILIHFPEPGISVYGYTDELRSKMTSSFSQLDIDPMWKKIMESLNKFLN
jgi:hypothetical protein